LVNLSGSAKPTVATPVPAPTPAATPTPSSANALPFSVNTGPHGESVDVPYASVTICAAGTSNCTTVENVLIDTGSFGLRVFGSQLSGLGIVPNTNGGSEVGECAFFGSGSTWGAVSTVDVKIAGEPTITIPIQVIDDLDAFAPAPRSCTDGSQLLSSPAVTQFDGLLGIGQSASDTSFTDYYDCSAGDCSALTSPPSADVVVNPVSSFPADNNGIVVSLPSVPASGAASAEGTIYFGIGTESDNRPATVTVLTADANPDSLDFLEIDTSFNGNTAGGIFDTGSNGYFFNDSGIPECSDAPDFYCPASTLSESATNQSVNGASSNAASFEVANAESLFDSDGAAFDDLAGSFDGGAEYDGFDWGLPFFFGRTVYLGIAGTSSSLGAGPYIAY
jgi:Protein of unknown function (DUF3443)